MCTADLSFTSTSDCFIALASTWKPQWLQINSIKPPFPPQKWDKPLGKLLSALLSPNLSWHWFPQSNSKPPNLVQIAEKFSCYIIFRTKLCSEPELQSSPFPGTVSRGFCWLRNTGKRTWLSKGWWCHRKEISRTFCQKVQKSDHTQCFFENLV